MIESNRLEQAENNRLMALTCHSQRIFVEWNTASGSGSVQSLGLPTLDFTGQLLMIIHMNGYPGVGKLTIGRELCRILNGRLLDNHSVYNVAFALTEFRSDAFYETVRAVRAIAYDRILRQETAGRRPPRTAKVHTLLLKTL
jgi:hypothetical protein